MNSKEGYVYILTNPSFKEDWVKIGKSARPVDVRSKELDNTAVPLPFDIYATLKTEKYDKVEKQIHKQIDRLTDLRIRQNREFFNIAPDQALAIMLDIATLLDDAEVYEYVGGEPLMRYPVPEERALPPNAAKRISKPSFKFSMVGLKVGDVITFDATGKQVKVAGDAKIEDEYGRLWSLSAYTATNLPEHMQNTSGSYQGPKFFSYEGKTLVEIRSEKEGVRIKKQCEEIGIHID